MLQAIQTSKIIVIPLTRPNSRILTSSGTNLNRYTYYQFQISAKKAKPAKPSSASSDESKLSSSHGEKAGLLAQIKEQGLANWTTGKAADTWVGFGKAKGWKLKVYQGGEKIVDRMDFEELALKRIDPSLGPSITKLKRSPVYNETNEPAKIPLIFPPSILSPSTALSELRAYADHRVPRHRKGFFVWMLVVPLTAPFMIIPIIPNLPFFFCVWRAWSHYRAYRSSQYLQSLLEHDILVPEPSESLDAVYKRHQLEASTEPKESSSNSATSSSSNTAADSSSSTVKPEKSETATKEPKDVLLLNRDDVPSILSILDLKPDSTAAVDFNRALEQARVRVSNGRAAL